MSTLDDEAAGTTASGGSAAADGEQACARCGCSHSARQRCPLDPAPASFTPRPQRPSMWPAYDGYGTPARPAYVSTYRPRHRWPARPVGGVGSPAVQWISAIVCTTVVIVCLSVAGVFIARMPELAHSFEESLTVVLVCAIIGAAFAAALYFTSRTFAGPAYAALSLTLVTGGVLMLALAPVIRQMNVRHLAEYRGFYSFLWLGLASTCVGLALGAVCVRWSLGREARRRVAGWGRLLMTSYGVLLGLTGMTLLLALGALINADSNEFFDDPSIVEQALALTSVALVSLLPGLLLTYHGISESMGEGSSELRLPVAAITAALFGAVMIVGQLNMRRASPLALPMPPLHVLAAALPGLTYVAFAGRGSLLGGAAVRGLTWRQITLSAGLSMSVATSIALYVEGLGSFVSVLLLLVHNGAFEFARNADAVWNIIGDADFILTENEQFAAGLIVAAILAPVSEEFAKSLSVRFTMRPTSTRAQCFLLGAAAGAAFGFLEAMFYGVSAISDDLAGWWQIMLLRGGSTSLHVICSGMAGIAWWHWSIARDHRPALALFGGAMLIHAAWNAFATVIDSRIFGLETLSNRALEIAAYSVVAVVSAAMILAVPIIARRLREAPVAPVEGTPLAGMRAWLG